MSATYPGTWVMCQAGDPAPKGAVSAPDQWGSYVCLWKENDFTLGRGKENLHGQGMDAWFPYGGKEHGAKPKGIRFEVLVDDGKIPGLYRWIQLDKWKSEKQKSQYVPLKVNGYTPTVIQNNLGKCSVELQQGWTCYGGHETGHDAATVLRSQVLCRLRPGVLQQKQAETKAKQSPQSPLPSARQIAKRKTLQNADRIESYKGFPAHYQLQMVNEYTNREKMLRRLSYGPARCTKPMKTILIVGATGAGKSTLINAIANHLLGVDFEDDYRLRIVREDVHADQSASVTNWVTAYVLYHQNTFPVEFPCSLMIVDTPGFGDTRGIQADEKIKEQLSHFFHGKGIEGIDSLNAIGFVTQSSLARLTPTQQYIFQSVLALFGKDIEENIFILSTFADGQTPPVLAAMQAGKIPYTECFKFNNSALFADRSSAPSQTDVPFDQFFWVMGASSYTAFLTHVARAKTKTLTLTNEVLDERDRLQTQVNALQQQIKIACHTADSLRDTLDCFIMHQTDIETNKNFEVVVTVHRPVKKDLPTATFVTNCSKCNFTCHYPCGIPDDGQKYGCAAMNGYGLMSSCTICPQKCGWIYHKNMQFRFIVVEVNVPKTAADIKEKYEKACQETLSTEGVILKIIEDYETVEREIIAMVEKVRENLKRLSEIALRPDPMTTTGYIDILIDSEKQQAKPGWQERVTQLQACKQRAELIKSNNDFNGNSEAFKALKEEIEDMKTKRSAGSATQGGMIDSMRRYRDKICRPKTTSSTSSGGWSDWSVYTDCNIGCGGGIQFQSRHCNNPAPQDGGAECTLLDDTQGTYEIRTRDCNVHSCPGNGRVDFLTWDVCDELYGSAVTTGFKKDIDASSCEQVCGAAGLTCKTAVKTYSDPTRSSRLDEEHVRVYHKDPCETTSSNGCCCVTPLT